MTHELMIGNWVMYKTTLPVSVTEISEYGITIMAEDLSKHNVNPFEFNDLSPIHITPEWLEKLGFERINIDYYIINKDNSLFILINLSAEKPLVYLFGNDEDLQLAYVHQIQNLITILNGKNHAK